MNSELLIGIGIGLIALAGASPIWWFRKRYPRRKRCDLSHIMANYLKPQFEGSKGKRPRW